MRQKYMVPHVDSRNYCIDCSADLENSTDWEPVILHGEHVAICRNCIAHCMDSNPHCALNYAYADFYVDTHRADFYDTLHRVAYRTKYSVVQDVPEEGTCKDQSEIES